MFPFYVHLEKTASEYKFVLEAEGFWIDGVLVPSPKTLGFVLVLSISDKCCSDFPQLPRLLLFFKTKVKKKKRNFMKEYLPTSVKICLLFHNLQVIEHLPTTDN